MKRYAALVTIPLFLTACGDGDTASTVTSTTTESIVTTESISPSPATVDEESALLGSPDLEDKSAEVTEYEAVVTDIRVGTHDGFDRIVFDLEGPGIPGWDINYDAEPTAQGSGEPVPYTGDAALNLRISGLVLPFELGPDVNEAIGEFPGAGNVTGITALGTFEGQGQFVIGLDQQHPYSVQILTEPTRLVIDIVS
ncbi:MAG: hypothetical protein Q3976_07300 [Corynebacterium sp.]|nr:hypothetical protein [Corynebacterium sp.]